ncbi:hypothetical protein HDU67_002723 [Dinochytrium kinnereticum]|nr:hypothetical protein HDU67_002723 [Dinochytrium kinnereticum]
MPSLPAYKAAPSSSSAAAASALPRLTLLAAIAASAVLILTLTTFSLSAKPDLQPSQPDSVIASLGPTTRKYSPGTHKAIRVAFLSSAFGLKETLLLSDQISSHADHFCVDRPWFKADHFVFSDVGKGDDALVLQKSSAQKLERLGGFEIVSTPAPAANEDLFKVMLQTVETYRFNYDYIYWQSPESRLIRNQCEDMLGRLVAVYHSDFISYLESPYEQDPESAAYIPNDTSRSFHPYLAGTLFGGHAKDFHLLLTNLTQMVENDKKRKLYKRPERGAEAYLNAYFHNVQIPHVVLGRGFATKKSKAMDFDLSFRMAAITEL